MGPCAVCGAVTMDAAGYCTQCGTFRGAPPPTPQQQYGGQSPYQPPVSGGQSPYQPPVGGGYGPASGPGYGQPTSGIGYPTSGGPGGYPTSGPGYAPPTSGGGYPTAYPPPPGGGGKGKPFVIPLVALSVTLVVLVVAIVVVVLVRNSGDSGGGSANPTTPPPKTSETSAAPVGNVDPCVVGQWRVTSHREVVPVEDVGKVTFTGGEGAELELKADGNAVADYGDGTTYEGTLKGRAVKLVISGTLTFDFTARDGTVSVKNIDSDAKAKIFFDGEQVGSERSFEGDDDPSKYECSADSLVQRTDLYETQFTKVS